MIRTKKQKIITLSIVFVAVLVLSIGFAVYSNSLYIKSKLRVEPNASEFGVVFSTSSSSVQTGNITPTVSGSATAEAATINNSTTPTIETLSATFTSPGDKVVYSLYSYNAGGYDAYLTNIIFNNASSGSTFKVCTANTGTTQSTVDSACNSIKVTVTAGSTSATATQTVSDHLLSKGKSEVVTITIEYLSSGSEADGPFTVEFGDISLVYSSVDESTSSSEYTVGDVVTLGGESFYVIETSNSVAYSQDENSANAVTLLSNESNNASTYLADSTSGTVTLLAKYNLQVGYKVSSVDEPVEITTSTVRQSTSNSYCDVEYDYDNDTCYGAVPFSSSNYWGEVEYGTFIYDSNSYLYSYVESYEAYLQSLGWSSASATLISYDQLRALGCSEGYCDNAPEWVYSSLYWTGSARGTVSTNSVYTVGAMRLQHYRGSCATCSMNMSNFGWDFHPGIRPVITVNISDIS